MGKKSKKKNKKVAAKVESWVKDSPELSEADLILAGLGVMAKAVESKGKKSFRKAVDRGRKLLEHNVPVLEALASDGGDTRAREPVISYRPKGGGWYTIEIDGIAVDSVKGEVDAANRAADLLTAFAALTPDAQEAARTEMRHAGGGWYEISVRGVPIGRIRGREVAEERFAAITGAADQS